MIKYLLLLAALCWPVRAGEAESVHIVSDVCLNDRGEVVECPKPTPLTTKWVYVTTQGGDKFSECYINAMKDFHHGNWSHCDKFNDAPSEIELGLRSDGAVVWR